MNALTLAQAARIMREAMRDEGWQRTPLGEDVAAYLRSKRKNLTPASFATYSLSLAELAVAYADLRVEDFETPIGTERLEEFLDRRYGHLSPRTYNKHLRITKSFFDHWRTRMRLRTDPCFAIKAAKASGAEHEIFSRDEVRAMLAANQEPRDQIALRLLLHYALRKGSLKAVQFKHFDHGRKRLTYFAKGSKVCRVPIRDEPFWHDLERLILAWEVTGEHFLMASYDGNQHHQRLVRERPMGAATMHKWFYRCQWRAGIVAEGTERGSRLHKTRHTAGQRLLDATQNLRAVQSLLAHESIRTTADIYTHWDEDRLAASLIQAQESESFEAGDSDG